MKKLFVTSLLAFCFTGLALAQTALTQTTLSSQVTQGPAGVASGISGSYLTQVTLGSSTGITAAFNGVQPVSFGLIDQELVGFISNPTGTTWNVLRGQQGTKVSAHASGQMVLIQTGTPQFSGGGAGSGGFQPGPPPVAANCTGSSTLFTPWVDITTSYQWLCSSITNTWVPGFNNPLAPAGARVTAAQASVAGACTISGPLFHTTGTNACTSFTIPTGFNATAVGGGQWCTIPDGAFSTTATNNIAKATTAVVNQTLCFTWDATNSKFTASY